MHASSAKPRGGYGLTKWACERRLMSALAAGQLASLCVARLGLVGSMAPPAPAAPSGFANHGDWVALLLRACHAAGCTPELAGDGEIVLLPVDRAAEALAALADVRSGTSRVVHLDGIAAGVAVLLAADLLSRLGLPRVPHATWRAQVAGTSAAAALAVLPAGGDGLRLGAGRPALELAAGAAVLVALPGLVDLQCYQRADVLAAWVQSALHDV